MLSYMGLTHLGSEAFNLYCNYTTLPCKAPYNVIFPMVILPVNSSVCVLEKAFSQVDYANSFSK